MSEAIVDCGMKKYRNLKPGTLVILGGYPLYKDGVLTVSGEDLEKNQKELDRLTKMGFIEEVPLDAKAAPFVPERTRDVLDQEDDTDEEGLFVQPKQPNIFNIKNPKPVKKEEDKTVEEKIEEQETVKDNPIDARPVTLQEDGKVVDDGFEGTGRKTSCLDGLEWREQLEVVKDLKDLNELDIIIKSSTYKAVVKAAELRRNELLNVK